MLEPYTSGSIGAAKNGNSGLAGDQSGRFQRAAKPPPYLVISNQEEHRSVIFHLQSQIRWVRVKAMPQTAVG